MLYDYSYGLIITTLELQVRCRRPSLRPDSSLTERISLFEGRIYATMLHMGGLSANIIRVLLGFILLAFLVFGINKPGHVQCVVCRKACVWTARRTSASFTIRFLLIWAQTYMFQGLRSRKLALLASCLASGQLLGAICTLH